MSTFSKEEVLIMNDLEGKSINSVVYHKWANYSKPSQIYFCVDFIEITFDQGGRIVFSGKDPEAISIIDFNLEKEKQVLEREFGGKIKLESESYSKNPPWNLVLERPISFVALRKSENHEYLNDAIIINFEGNELLIFNNGEGLVAELLEDEDTDE